MKIQSPVVDYRQFRLGKLNTAAFRHLKLLLYWPVYGLLFTFVEKYYPVDYYYPMYCPLDDLIPFCEVFVLPYMFWFVYIAGLLLYTLLYDIESFRRLMKFIMITYTVTIVIYFLFPTCQELRPTVFPRDNFLSRFMGGFYEFDTNTNVCPSIHVIGSLAVLSAAWNTRGLRSVGWRTAFAVTAVLICLSTVFLKQHSILDVAAALPLCAVAHVLCYRKRPQKAPCEAALQAPCTNADEQERNTTHAGVNSKL